MKTTRWLGAALCGTLMTLAACGGGGSDSAASTATGTTSAQPIAGFARGADVGWITQQEAAGQQFRDTSGAQQDPFALLHARGIDAIRLRVWVNPADGWNGLADVLAKARRAAAQGQRIMIDFHYSDTWADPGHQTRPAAWAGHDYAALKDDVYAHTHDVLDALRQAGIAVEWVQVGNEINSGMLWPEGSYQNFSQLAGFINAGYAAVKAVYPQAKVVVHLSSGSDNAMYRWFFDAVKAAGAQWDIIGLSHYPSASGWASANAKIGSNMADMVARYAKPVMVTEVGMDWQQAATTKAMLSDLITRVAAQGEQGLGVFYWEPDAAPNWQGYTMGALDADGRFTAALDAFAH
ncbi:glycosyl hydrolase 53 family protein [Niveibacterium sp. SC-1]|uniref:glycoside hydrolase family 53 protein n=1 Tax=Niveibacterium sp. SC-1 TaxID=3135646 RepID=UPI00311E3160